MSAAHDPSTSGEGEEPSRVLYIGHLPHGFYEDQLKGFFSQFGKVTKVRVSRNKKTGKAKHYAFLEFQLADVAAIAAEAMDGYMMFTQKLVVRVVPTKDVHQDLWKGANRKFDIIPWRKIEKERHNAERSPEQQKARLDRAVRRDKQRQRRIRQSGIHYSYEPLKDAIQQAKRVKLADDISKPMELGASAAEAATAPEKGAQAAKAEGAAAAAPKKGPQGAKAADAAAPGKGSQAAKDSAASKKESAAATVADSSAPRKAKRSAAETDRVVKKAKGAGVDDGDKGAAEKPTAAEGNEKAAPKDHKSPRVAAGSALEKAKRTKADMDSAPAQPKRAKLVEKKGKRAVKAAEKKAGKGKRSKMQ